MKKSPFSTPRGNGGRQGLWNSGGSPGRGYGRPKSYEFHSPNNSQTSQSGGEDFIPFDNTPPPAQRKSGEWQSPRGQWQGGSGGGGGGRGNRRQSSSPGYNNYRDNRGRDNNHHHHQHHHHHQQQPPYFKDGGRQFHRQRKNFQQRGNTRTKPDISQYVNLKWFLEDPWSELTRKSSCHSTDVSRNESSSDLSFSNAAIDDVSLDDSMDGGSAATAKSQEIVASDSHAESDNSFLRTSQEFADTSADCSQDPKLSQDSND